jgi:ferredoxin-NADP reductase
MIAEQLKQLPQSDQDALTLAFEEERSFVVEFKPGEYIGVHLPDEYVKPLELVSKEGFWFLLRNKDVS